MLLLIPASLAAHSHELAALLLGILCLGAAALVLVAGIWLPYRWVNLAALVFSGLAAVLFRVLSHTAKLHEAALGLCFIAAVIGAFSAWRTYHAGKNPAPIVRRIRRRKRRPHGPDAPHSPQ